MKVIVGLGNPGAEYERTRHNVGWWVVDHLADVWRFGAWGRDGEARTVTGVVQGAKVRLIKPLTFMNLSGSVLKPYMRRPFWSPGADLLIIVDDVAIPVGTLRLRAKGSAGGHNGLKSIEGAVGSQDYARLRVGIRPADERRLERGLSDFVLDEFGKLDTETVEALMPRIVDAAQTWATAGIERAMSVCNTEGKTP